MADAVEGAGGAAVQGFDVYEYAVLRVVPRVDRGEFLNVGVLLWCRAREHLAARAGLEADRVLALDPAADVVALERHVAALQRVCAGDLAGGAAAAEPRGPRFRWLTAPRSTVVQTSPVHRGLTRDPVAELDRLFVRLVERA